MSEGPAGPTSPPPGGPPAPWGPPSTIPPGALGTPGSSGVGPVPPAGPAGYAPGYAPGYYSQGAPPPSHRRRTLWIAVGVAAAAVVVILAALFSSGALTTPSGALHGPLTYRVAESQVMARVSGYQGGNWKVLGADGIASSVGAGGGSVGAGLNSSVGGCNTTLLVSNTTTLALPAYNGSLKAGIAPGWAFALFNTAGALLIVVDINGTATPVVEITGTAPSCALTSITTFLSGVPSNAIDSSQASAAAWNAGGGAFVTAHPGASASFTIVSGVSVFGFTVPPRWSVTFQACTAQTLGNSTPVPTFNATINALTGQVTATSNLSQPCLGSSALGGNPGSSATPLGSVLAFGSASAFTYGGTLHGFSVPVAAAAQGIRWTDVSFAFFNSSNYPSFPTSGNVTVEGVTGTALAVYNFSTASWSGGGIGAVTSTETLRIYLGATDLSGGWMLVAPTNPSYSGTIRVTFP